MRTAATKKMLQATATGARNPRGEFLIITWEFPYA